MSLTHLYPKWRQADDLPVFRTISGPARVIDGDRTLTFHDVRREWRTQFRACPRVDYVEGVKLTWRIFELPDGDDWSDGARCPCGEMIETTEWLLGELVDACNLHIKQAHR